MRSILVLVLTAVVAAPAAYAQKPPSGGTVVASEPGKAVVATTVDLTAVVTGIEKATRTVTLKGPKGNAVDVVAGDEVKNFDQLRVGDNVKVSYVEALSLELKKTKGKLGAKSESAAVGAEPGSRPAGAVGRQTTVLADVVAVDPKKSIISLKGPRGNVVDLKVRNPDHFKVVKKGDQVEAVYTEALAMSVMPAAKEPAKK